MSRTYAIIAGSLVSAASLAAAVTAQAPRVSNGALTTQPAGAPFTESFRTLVSSRDGVFWIGYSVPLAEAAGRSLCCFDGAWAEGRRAGCPLEPSTPGSRAESATSPAPQTPVKLEGADRMAVLFRVEERRVDRVRVFSEDCPLDAGGRPVVWLDGVQPPASVALLETLTASDAGRRQVVNGAVAAIALHGDPAADASLERLVAASQPETVRREIPFWLGHARGRHGLEVLRRVIREDPSPEVRKKAAFGISQSRETDADASLIDVARNHADAAVRGEAIFWLGQKAGARAASTIAERIELDPETDVKKKAVFALSQMPKDEGVPLLINVARTNRNPEVRKQAFFWLGQSRDPRAIDFFAQVLNVK